MRHPAEHILARYHRAMLDKSADDLADLYAENAVHTLPFTHDDSGVLKGREAIRARYKAAWAAAPVKVREIVNVVIHRMADPDWVATEQDILAMNTETGAAFEASFVLIMHIRNDKIVEVRDYTDNLTIARALGRAPFQR